MRAFNIFTCASNSSMLVLGGHLRQEPVDPRQRRH
jgi:hypothetical protein